MPTAASREEGRGGGEDDGAYQLAVVVSDTAKGGTATINGDISSTCDPPMCSNSLLLLSSSVASATGSATTEPSVGDGNPPPLFLSQQLPYAHLLDTLPYVDALSPEQHEAAKLMVQQEMATIRREHRRRHINNRSTSSSSSSNGPSKQDSDHSTTVQCDSNESTLHHAHEQTKSEETENTSSNKSALKAQGSVGESTATATTTSARTIRDKSVSADNRDDTQSTSNQTDADADQELLLRSYLKNFPLPSTPHLDDPNTLAGKELARIARGEPMQRLDLSKYEALPSAPTAGVKAQESEWRKCVDNCEGLLEHLGNGQTNMELMNLHAVSLWMRHLHGLTLGEQHWSAAAKRVRAEVDRVSKQRKLDQVECAASLRDTARMREDYERRNGEILAALGKLQQEVVEMKLRCLDRGVLPDDYDSDFEEDFDDWDALVSPPTSSMLSAGASIDAKTEDTINKK